MRMMAVVMLSSAVWLAGCGLSHSEGNTSGSNWLRCKTLSECAAPSAVACSSDGYCTDQEGERIDSQRSTLKPTEGEPKPDAGTLENELDSACAWGIDEALAKLRVTAPKRENCGIFGLSSAVGNAATLRAAQGCFDRARRTSNQGVELTMNRCFDCSIPTTYVAAPDGKLYAVLLEDDSFGDGLREVKVQSCDSVALNSAETDFECANPGDIYTCTEARSITRALPSHPPVTPYKLSDPPSAAGATKATVHLYISNQSFDLPQISISASVDDSLVVLGDFAVGSQHSWLLFNLEVPLGTHTLSVNGLNYNDQSGTGGASRNSQISIAAERWLVVDYWYSKSDPKGGHFTLTESDVPVGFN